MVTAGILTGRAQARLATQGHFAHHGHTVLFVLLFRDAPGALPIMLLTLAVGMYLAVIELRELRPHWKWWFWWLSVVFLIHFPGYLALRIYGAFRRRNRARA